MSYAQDLKHPKWQKHRLKMLERDEYSCRVCGTKEITLHVHHTDYIKGRKPWEYPDEMLITLCEKHHKALHDGEAVLISEVIEDILEGGIRCDTCDGAVTNKQGYGFTKPKFFCEKCTIEMEPDSPKESDDE